jgi:Flp pilus assembly pilin Flp
MTKSIRLRRPEPADFRNDRRGASYAEYALVAAIAAVIVVGSVRQLGNTIDDVLRIDLAGLAAGSGSGDSGSGAGAGSGADDGDAGGAPGDGLSID